MPEFIDIKGLDELRFYFETAVFGLLAVFAWRAFGYARRQWNEWQWQRRTAREPMVFLDEQREYERSVEVSEEEANLPGLGEGILRPGRYGAALFAAFALALYLGMDWQALFFYFGIVFAFFGWLWSKVHAEPSREISDLESEISEPAIPEEMITAFGAAVACIAVFAALIFAL